MKSYFSKIFAFLILAICTIGVSSATVSAFAHDPSDEDSNGEYHAGYERGYQHGYRHGYQDASTGQTYENAAESHGAEAYGPYGEGMHEGEHTGYNAGFQAGSGHHYHHHHHGIFERIFGDDGQR